MDHYYQELSHYLRTGGDTFLWLRRGIVLTSFVAALCMMLIALFQVGILRGLPDPPLPHLDSDKVDGAAAAYRPLGLPLPDAFLGLVSYAVTALLAAAAGQDRWQTLWWLPVLLGGKVLVDAVQAGRLSYAQWADHHAFCIWCLIAAAATFIAVPLALPETLAAVRYAVGLSRP